MISVMTSDMTLGGIKMGKRIVNKPDAAKLTAMYRIMTQSEIAGAYNVTVRTVARWLRAAGISKPEPSSWEARSNE